MEKHQLRVVSEMTELDTKIEALTGFVKSDFYKTIDLPEQGRLEDQLRVMLEYSDILNDRIENFKI